MEIKDLREIAGPFFWLRGRIVCGPMEPVGPDFPLTELGPEVVGIAKEFHDWRYPLRSRDEASLAKSRQLNPMSTAYLQQDDPAKKPVAETFCSQLMKLREAFAPQDNIGLAGPESLAREAAWQHLDAVSAPTEEA